MVSKAAPALRTDASRAVSVGRGVWDTAILSGGSEPRGKITFRLYGPDDSGCAGPPVFTVEQVVIGNGRYRSATFVPQQAGSYLWIATYSGDENNAPAVTRCGDPEETVVALPRRLLMTTSASPRANLGTGRRVLRAGLSIYDAATLKSGFAPTGEITFRLFGPTDPSCSGTPVFTSAAAVNGNGVYNSEGFTPTESGTYRWVAMYSGDANNRPAGPGRCGEPAEEVRITLLAEPELTTSASAAVDLGGEIRDTAHLSGGSAPTGTITFRLYGHGDNDCSEDPIFTSTVRVSGNDDYVSEPYVPTDAGVYRWVATYSGDGRNRGVGPTSCGDQAELAIVRPASLTPVTPSFSTTASASSGVGGPVYDTAHLSGGVAAFGSITFSLYGPEDATCSAPPAFTTISLVSGNGDYRSEPFIPSHAGTYRWVASYTGDAMNINAGPTPCGEPAETLVVSAGAAEVDSAGPNVPAVLPKPRDTSKQRPPRRPPPRVAG